MKNKDYVGEFLYWWVQHPLRSLFRKFIWHLPNKVVYWCIIRAVAEVKNETDPFGVTAQEMLERFPYKGN